MLSRDFEQSSLSEYSVRSLLGIERKRISVKGRHPAGQVRSAGGVFGCASASLINFLERTLIELSWERRFAQLEAVATAFPTRTSVETAEQGLASATEVQDQKSNPTEVRMKVNTGETGRGLNILASVELFIGG